MSGERIAILGGSFNPVHKGHLFIAGLLLDPATVATSARGRASPLPYERVIFMPARQPPHKELAAGASVADRLAMLRLACTSKAGDAQASRFFVDDFELQKSGPSYTIETIRALPERYNLQGKPGLIIGEDLLAGFHTWKEAAELTQLVDLIVLRRKQVTQHALSEVTHVQHLAAQAQHGAKVMPARQNFVPEYFSIDNVYLDISSTMIREAIKKGADISEFVPEAVARYIDEHKLYREEANA